jgi:hypothetical protein
MPSINDAGILFSISAVFEVTSVLGAKRTVQAGRNIQALQFESRENGGPVLADAIFETGRWLFGFISIPVSAPGASR